MRQLRKLPTPLISMTLALTPFAAIRVMLALEEAFDVEFPPEMLRRQSFSLHRCYKRLPRSSDANR